MKSRDGFEEVNRELREGAWVHDPLTRRAMLQALGMGTAGLAGLSAGLPGPEFAGGFCARAPLAIKLTAATSRSERIDAFLRNSPRCANVSRHRRNCS